MSTLGPYEVHPFTAIIPDMTEVEFNFLVSDVKQHGLLKPIVLNHEGTVLLDGRQRYRACEAAGVEPSFRRLEADLTEVQILEFIHRVNVLRQHLTPEDAAEARMKGYRAKSVT